MATTLKYIPRGMIEQNREGGREEGREGEREGGREGVREGEITYHRAIQPP